MTYLCQRDFHSSKEIELKCKHKNHKKMGELWHGKNGFCEIWFNGSEKMFQKLKRDWKEEKRNVFNWNNRNVEKMSSCRQICLTVGDISTIRLWETRQVWQLDSTIVYLNTKFKHSDRNVKFSKLKSKENSHAEK